MLLKIFFSFLAPRFFLPLFLIVILAFASGCTPTRISSAPDQASGAIINPPEEVVIGPELPDDDGITLTHAERLAMESTGELDKGLSAEEKKQVELHFKYFVHKKRDTFERFLERGERYLPYLKRTLRERGLPEEIAYLAMVESGYNPNAISPVGALGMWQFMPFTGKKYGLMQNAWVDERRDPFKATHSAADYLLKLHGDFGNWLFAIAAYNAGEGKIGKAIECTGAEDFFELCRLNNTIPEEKTRLKNETQQYVPRFLAVCKIMRNLEALGFKKPNSYLGYDLAEITVPEGCDLNALARKLGMKWEDFSAVNPAFKRTISPPFATSQAYVPKSQKELAMAWLVTKEAKIYAGWDEYKVRKGDTLSKISKKFGTPMDLIRVANKLKSDKLRVGAVLLVPGDAAAARDFLRADSGGKGAPKAVASAAASGSAKAVPGRYTVKQGDTLFFIAKAYDVNLNDLRAANGMRSGESALQLGQILNIPGGVPAAAPASAKKAVASAPDKKAATAAEPGKKTDVTEKIDKPDKQIVVRQGDTLYALARRNNTSVDEICSANGITDKSRLKPGQKLILP